MTEGDVPTGDIFISTSDIKYRKLSVDSICRVNDNGNKVHGAIYKCVYDNPIKGIYYTEEDKKKYRAKFIKDFAIAAKGGAFNDNVDQAFVELAVSKMYGCSYSI
jgi:hypothetical protein